MAFGNIHLTPQLVQAVRDAVDILEIASEHTRMRKAGRRYSGLCPLHREKTPSFSVDPDQGLFYCFGCGRGGDAIKLHMILSGDDFPAAIEALAQRYGIPLPTPTRRAGGPAKRDLRSVLEAAAAFFVQRLQSSKSTRDYLERRRVAPEIVERLGLGYAPDSWHSLLENLHPRFPLADLEAAGLVSRSERDASKSYDRFRHRLMFPIHVVSGRLVGFGGRALGDDRAKYINTSETEQFQKGSLLYGLDRAKREIRQTGTVLVVEGYFDVVGALASGVPETVATMGTALTAAQARLLARFAEEVVVGYDADDAGEQAFRRSLPLLLAHGLTVRRARFGDGHDPDSLRLAKGEEAVRQAVEQARDGVEIELERRIPGKVAADPRLRARSAREVTELLRSIPDGVVRYSYGRQAADRLGVPVELLLRQLDRAADTPQRPAEAAEPAPPEVRSLEENVLQQLLRAEGELPPPQRLPPPEAFLIPVCRNIYRLFCDLYSDGGGVRPTAKELLAAVTHDGGEVDQVARLLLEGAPASRGEGLDRALRRVERRWQQQRLRGLASAIAEAERQGDEGRLERLVREKTALSLAMHRGGRDAAGDGD